MYWRRRLTRLELAIYVSLIGIVVAAFLERGLYYMEVAERAAMDVTVSRVNSGINLRRAMEMLREGRAADPSGQNPFEFARYIPPNFRGDVVAFHAGSVERGGWVFDAERQELVYLPRLHRLLVTPERDAVIRFRWGPESKFMLVPISSYTWG